MSVATFRKAAAAVNELSDILVLGGGEPTIHPRFWQLFGIALELDDLEMLYLVTNGKKAATAKALARLARDNAYFDVSLSLDCYHEPIDPSVIKLFKSYKLDVRTGVHNPILAGRCTWGDPEACVCEELFVTCSGDVKVCGCPDSPVLGNLTTGVLDDVWVAPGYCYKQQNTKDKLASLKEEEAYMINLSEMLRR